MSGKGAIAHRVALELVGDDGGIGEVGEVVNFDDSATSAVDGREVGRVGRTLIQPVHGACNAMPA